jgi:hypothetical protein
MPPSITSGGTLESATCSPPLRSPPPVHAARHEAIAITASRMQIPVTQSPGETFTSRYQSCSSRLRGRRPRSLSWHARKARAARLRGGSCRSTEPASLVPSGLSRHSPRCRSTLSHIAPDHDRDVAVGVSGVAAGQCGRLGGVRQSRYSAFGDTFESTLPSFDVHDQDVHW